MICCYKKTTIHTFDFAQVTVILLRSGTVLLKGHEEKKKQFNNNRHPRMLLARIYLGSKQISHVQLQFELDT